MTLRMMSISVIAVAAVSGGGALAQSVDNENFCDTGYFQADANSDGMVDKEELQQVTDAEFSALDANADGTITRAEYADCLGNWTSKASNTELPTNAEFQSMDLNDDGMISQSEYLEAVDQEYMARWGETGTGREVRDADFAPATPENMGGPGNEEMSQDDEANTTNYGAADKDMTAAGTDTDQQMSDDLASEPKLILRRIIFMPADGPRTLGEMSRDEVAHRTALQFVLLDTDRDKVIGPQEQEVTESDRAGFEEVLNQRFDRADADQSDSISREEYMSDAQSRWEEAQKRGQSEGNDSVSSDVGAPVVYYRYPHPM